MVPEGLCGLSLWLSDILDWRKRVCFTLLKDYRYDETDQRVCEFQTSKKAKKARVSLLTGGDGLAKAIVI